MPVRILDITKVQPTSYSYYFFDANCWITNLLYISGTPTELQQRNEHKKYRNFFSQVVTAAIKPPITQKTVTVSPKIVLTSLLISEIFNAYMHLKFSVYQKTTPGCTKFKTHYRQTHDYEKHSKNLASDFAAFEDYVVIESDYIDQIGPFTIFQLVSQVNDFNDLYSYYQLMEIKKTRPSIAIVTDDADFVFPDIDIITANHNLLKLNKSK